MGTRLGGALAPPLIVVLMGVIGWRAAFVVFGAIGVVWCVFWSRWFKDDPSTHPAVNGEELEMITRGLPARAALPAVRLAPVVVRQRDPAVPDVLHDAIHLVFQPDLAADVPEGSPWIHGAGGRLRRGAVLLAGAIANWIGGRLTDSLTRRYGVRVGRSLGAVTLPLSGLVLVAAAMVENRPGRRRAVRADARHRRPLRQRVLGDVPRHRRAARRHLGGAMNTVGNIGGAISPLVVGYTVQWWGSWTLPFFITAGVYVAGGIFTLLVDPRKPIWPAASDSGLGARDSGLGNPSASSTA